jgi:hypothetical protein
MIFAKNMDSVCHLRLENNETGDLLRIARSGHKLELGTDKPILRRRNQEAKVRHTILEAIQLDNDPNTCITTERYDRMINHTQADWWTPVKHLSDDDRWRGLEAALLSKLQAGDKKRLSKPIDKMQKSIGKSSAETQHGNDKVCTSCFRLESGLTRRG